MTIKKRAIIDCDGVLAEFTSHIVEAIGRIEEAPDLSTFTTWDIFNNHMNERQRACAFSILASNEFWATQPVIAGAKEAVRRLHEADIDVHVVTSPWLGNKEWAAVRTAWLKENLGIDWRKVHTSGDKYLYAGAVFVDDKPEHVEAWHADQVDQGHAHRQAYVFSQQYNESFDWPFRLRGWTDEAVDRVIISARNPQRLQ